MPLDFAVYRNQREAAEAFQQLGAVRNVTVRDQEEDEEQRDR